MKTSAMLTGLALAGSLALPLQAAPLADPAQEAKAQAMFAELRCVVCEGESLSSSRSKLAENMREVVRGQIAEGKSEEDIYLFLVARYGEEIRQTPPVQPSTWLLWTGPFVFLLAGFWLVRRQIR